MIRQVEKTINVLPTACTALLHVVQNTRHAIFIRSHRRYGDPPLFGLAGALHGKPIRPSWNLQLTDMICINPNPSGARYERWVRYVKEGSGQGRQQRRTVGLRNSSGTRVKDKSQLVKSGV